MSASRKPQAAALILILGVALGVPESSAQTGNPWYAAPWGTPSGNGSWINPWDLQTALNHPAVVQAGDTIWLRGGTYTSTGTCGGGVPPVTFLFCSQLTGNENAPIIVRSYPDEWAVIEAGQFHGTAIIQVKGAYTWYWGFQVKGSPTDRQSDFQISTIPPDIDTTTAFQIADPEITTYPGIKFINLVIRDTAAPHYHRTKAIDTEVYGNFIFNNGWTAPDRGHGHGIYLLNQTGTKRARDNIVFNQFGSGLHGYADREGELTNIYAEGNILFNNGVLGTLYDPPYRHGYQDNVTIGDSVEAVDPVVTRNYTYFTPAEFPGGRTGGRSQLGHAGTSLNAVATYNYFVAQDGRCLLFLPAPPAAGDPNAVIQHNVFYGSTCSDKNEYWDTLGPYRGWLDDNTFFQAAPTLCFPDPPDPPEPTGIESFVRPNFYEPGRGNIVVYNWDLAANVAVDVSSVLQPGDTYILRDVQNWYGVPLMAGAYGGATISIPMPDENQPVTAPIGTPPGQLPKHTPRQFGVFVIFKTGSIPHENGPGPG